MTAQQFNQRYPVGTLVRYFPTTKSDAGVPTQTTSQAWDRGPDTIVALAGYRDGVAVNQVEVDGHE